MSRSEHGRSRDRTNPVDVARKARIKRLSVAERRARPRPWGMADGITIGGTSASYVHHPASAADLRGVMERLPAGTIDGIGSIGLRVGDVEENIEEYETYDPYIERYTSQKVHGVWQPTVLGRYLFAGARIDLFGYIYDPEVAEREIVELYLRMQMLATFVHEIAHHVERTRTSRGRWVGTQREKSEEFAERVEQRWAKEIVVPYIAEAYPAQVTALERWCVKHGGVALPLEMLVDPPDDIFLRRSAFQALLSTVLEGEKSSTQTKTRFAFDLHYGYHFDLAMAVLDGVLATDPYNLDALGWRAHVLGHLARHAEAVEIARSMLKRDPAHRRALEILAAAQLRL